MQLGPLAPGAVPDHRRGRHAGGAGRVGVGGTVGEEAGGEGGQEEVVLQLDAHQADLARHPAGRDRRGIGGVTQGCGGGAGHALGVLVDELERIRLGGRAHGASCGGDFEQIHVFHEAQQKNRSLPLRQTLRGAPDRR